MLNTPILIQTDSYKAGHAQMYPAVKEMTAYMECRGPFNKDNSKIVFYGLRYLYETVINRRITLQDIEEADRWYATHGVAKSEFYYPRDLWLAVVLENDGYLPFQIKALREGSVIYPHVPFLQITAREKFAPLVTWLETRLTHLWSPIVTSTKSRLIRDMIEAEFKRSVDDDCQFLLDSRFHDFGYRGVSSEETAMTTGIGHLLSFEGTDNMPAAWLATQFNNGIPVGESVLATEHSVMTSWDTEIDAILNLINTAPQGSIISVVADSYDYDNFLDNILPIVAPASKAKGLIFVIRPDSGDPVLQVEKALIAASVVFGYTTNNKGYKVLSGAAIIQGDGLDFDSIKNVINRVNAMGFSAQNVAYGMGGGLLQKQNRDTLRVATKLSHIVTINDISIDKMKHPKTDPSKFSLPGKFKVVREGEAISVLPDSPTSWKDNRIETNLLEVVWNSRPTTYKFETFQQSRNRLKTEWNQFPKQHNPISDELQKKIDTILNE